MLFLLNRVINILISTYRTSAITFVMNLYTLKISSSGHPHFTRGFFFLKKKPRPHIDDNLLREIWLRQYNVAMKTNRVQILQGLLINQDSKLNLYHDPYNGENHQALIHFKIRDRVTKVSPARSDKHALIERYSLDQGYSSFIYNMRDGDIIDVYIDNDRTVRLTSSEGVIEMENLCFAG